MLNIGNKTFMNLQEAVAWLLENNALPFQSTAKYAGGVEIAMSTLINPSPAKVRVGSLIFFADSKVATVIGVTSNSFIVSEQYNDLVDDVVYVSNVAINASGHLIVTLSNGNTIDAGLIKQVSNFSINGSQHLIVNYNDGTTTDLGAIFSGNVNIDGDFTANSIIENMIGYSFSYPSNTLTALITYGYAGVVKNGNKITFVIAGNLTTADSDLSGITQVVGNFAIPRSIGENIYPINGEHVAYLRVALAKDYTSFKNASIIPAKFANTSLGFYLSITEALQTNTNYYFRFEFTVLLSDNLAS